MDIFSFIRVFWLLSEIVLNLLLRSKMPDAKQLDKNSISIIWVSIIGSITALVFVAIFINIPILENNMLKYAGLVLIVAGVSLHSIVNIHIFPKSRLKLELNPPVPEGVFVSLDKVGDFKKWVDGTGNA